MFHARKQSKPRDYPYFDPIGPSAKRKFLDALGAIKDLGIIMPFIPSTVNANFIPARVRRLRSLEC